MKGEQPTNRIRQQIIQVKIVVSDIFKGRLNSNFHSHKKHKETTQRLLLHLPHLLHYPPNNLPPTSLLLTHLFNFFEVDDDSADDIALSQPVIHLR